MTARERLGFRLSVLRISFMSRTWQAFDSCCSRVEEVTSPTSSVCVPAAAVVAAAVTSVASLPDETGTAEVAADSSLSVALVAAPPDAQVSSWRGCREEPA
jgi:hypothetical protein